MPMTPQQKRELLAAAECDPRTLNKWLKGLPLRENAQKRLDGASRELGLYKFRGNRHRVKVSRG